MTQPERGWPSALSVNAWSGVDATAPLAPRAPTWAVQPHLAEPRVTLAAPPRPDLSDWRDPRVGWGLVLPDDPALSDAERARAEDAPEPIRRLAAARSPGRDPVVLRYHPGPGGEDVLNRHYPDGEVHPLAVVGGRRGVGRGELPYYLLLCAAPSQIPWEVQFQLNLSSFVGRLDLVDEGLGRYVDAVLSGWGGAVDPTAPLLWSVQHDPGDITWLMRQTVGEPVFRCWVEDDQIGNRAHRLAGAEATGTALGQALAATRPGVVVTTSHGMSGPVEEPARMRRDLGLPVDAEHAILDVNRLLADWEPNGVVWYAHACCSAGGAGGNRFAGLVEPGSTVDRVLEAVAALGAVTAPLPRALLGATRPARAFVGHVEPTFDWTLRRPDTGQVTTDAVRDALYGQLFQAVPPPVGLAFRRFFVEAASMFGLWSQARRDAGSLQEGARTRALMWQLCGIDRQCAVILGDPAVAPAALPSR
jgi:hypothetical protein